MFENEQPNSEINLNLKMPPEQPDGDFSMRNLVLTLYDARRVFLVWCFLGLLLGIVASGWYYLSNRSTAAPAAPADVSVTLTLNYAGAENALFPNGTPFDARSFFENADLWAGALRMSGNDSVTVGDVLSQVIIAKQSQDDIPADNVYTLTIPSGSSVFGSIEAKKDFLQALCEEFKESMSAKYYSAASIGTQNNQLLKAWDDACAEIAWDPYLLDKNLSALSSRYHTLAGILMSLYNEDPAYRSTENRSFDDYARALREIYISDVDMWADKLSHDVYIRSVDRFISEAQFRIDTMERNRKYNLELVDLYSGLLASFRQSDGQGAAAPEAVALLSSAQNCAAAAADLQRQIDLTEYYLQVLETDETMVRSNSHEAEDALIGFINDLGSNQSRLRTVIFNYYKQSNDRASANAVVFSSSVVTAHDDQAPAGGVSTTRILMLLVGLTFVGFVIGFCGAFIRKYINEARYEGR